MHIFDACASLRANCSHVTDFFQLLGEVGRVYAVYSGGDVMVMVKGKSWVFNPLCLTHVSDLKEEEESEYDPRKFNTHS